MTGPRDWDKELADIDKLIGSEPAKALPAPQGAAAPAARPAGGAAAPTRAAGPNHTIRPIKVWAVALLGPLGAASLVLWPYGRACGVSLGVYLVGVLAVFGASVWTMRLAWTARRSTAMIVGLLTLLAACALAALEILPRVGYAKAAHTWICST